MTDERKESLKTNRKITKNPFLIVRPSSILVNLYKYFLKLNFDIR